MATPISLRGDFDRPMLRALALLEKAGSVTRRLLSLITIYEGGTRGGAARLGGVDLQTLRDWVLRFNAKGPDGLVDGKSSGRPPLLDGEQRRALVAMVVAGCRGEGASVSTPTLLNPVVGVDADAPRSPRLPRIS